MWILLAAAMLSPESSWERDYNCWEHEATDACWAEIRALYAVRPIEEVPAQGVRVRRIFLLDGIGRINLDGRGHRTQAGMISVEQQGDAMPVLTYRRTRDSYGARHVLVIPLSREDWAALLAATAEMRDYTSGGWDGCLHGWDFLIEAADPAPGGARIVRHRESSCANGVGLWLAERLTSIAVRALPRCGARPRDELWYRVDWLYRCSMRGRGLP